MSSVPILASLRPHTAALLERDDVTRVTSPYALRPQGAELLVQGQFSQRNLRRNFT